MKQFILLLVLPFAFAATFISCGDEEARHNAQAQADSVREVRSLDSVLQAKALHRNDSIQKIIDSLVAENFVLKEQDFPYPTYYHNSWYGIYTVRADVLVGIVDESGEFSIMSCLDGQDAGGDHNALTVEIGNSEYKATQCLGSINGSIGTGQQEYKLFGNTEAWTIATAIAKDTTGSVKVKPHYDDKKISSYDLSAKDCKAMRECVDLARQLRLIHAGTPAAAEY